MLLFFMNNRMLPFIEFRGCSKLLKPKIFGNLLNNIKFTLMTDKNVFHLLSDNFFNYFLRVKLIDLISYVPVSTKEKFSTKIRNTEKLIIDEVSLAKLSQQALSCRSYRGI